MTEKHKNCATRAAQLTAPLKNPRLQKSCAPKTRASKNHAPRKTCASEFHAPPFNLRH
jgi:hypothetical protein